jgi:D-beta-D-heptose 7-phosphate kinase/D-beta-D-heptose 1-phosphate adenosyltransferase
MNELAAYLVQWAHPKILVVGDVMLDRYTWGEVDRISPEAPVPVLRATSDEVRLGGAASVACLLRALEVQVELVGLIGDDASGRTLQRLLAEQSIAPDQLLLDAARPTTEKWRLLGRAERKQPHHIARIDQNRNLQAIGPIDQGPEQTRSQQPLGIVGNQNCLAIGKKAEHPVPEQFLLDSIDRSCFFMIDPGDVVWLFALCPA